MYKNDKTLKKGKDMKIVFRIFPDFVNAYPKNHQRIEVRYVDAVS